MKPTCSKLGERAPDRASRRAAELVVKPSRSATAATRARVWAATRGWLFSANDAVTGDTPAARARSLHVGRVRFRRRSAGSASFTSRYDRHVAPQMQDRNAMRTASYNAVYMMIISSNYA